jgi:hypothetical protein
MASFIDIFNPSFFMFLGIVVLVAALLIVYFESKMREQNHKISSMFSLVTAITDELNSVKMIALSGGGGGIRPNYIIPADGTKLDEVVPTVDESITLIEVSDDEDEDDEDEEEEGEEDEEEEDDSGSSEASSDSESDSEPHEIIEIGDLKSSDIKILNVNLVSSSQSFWAAAANEIIECEFEEGIEEMVDSFSSDSSSESGDDSDDMVVIEEIMVIKEEPSIEAAEEKPEPEIIDLTGDSEDEPAEVIGIPEIKIEPGTFNQLDLELKTIHISSLEEPTPFDSAVVDYTKASLNKLRQIVVVKGLVEDSSKSSKLKKGELLKLLGVSE